MADNRDPKPMPDRDAVLRAIQAHLGDECRVLDISNHRVECCPYYTLDPHDPSCETKLLWDIYDILSPKNVTDVKSDGIYYYAICPSCGKSLYRYAVNDNMIDFCQKCGAALCWKKPDE